MHRPVSRRSPIAWRARQLAAGLGLLMLAATSAWSRIPQEPPAGGGSGGPVTQSTPAETAPTPAGDDAQTRSSAGSEAPPEMQSSYVVRLYKMRPAKLWKGL